MAMPDLDDYWELPLPVLQNTHGQRAARGPQMIFLGSPGAEKAAYASRLAKLLNVPHISMGHLLRKEASTPSAYSKQVRVRFFDCVQHLLCSGVTHFKHGCLQGKKIKPFYCPTWSTKNKMHSVQHRSPIDLSHYMNGMSE